MEPTRMWEGGPLREFVAGDKRPDSSWSPYHAPERGLVGYTRSYVCERCQTSTVGVYRVMSPLDGQQTPLWVCSGCRELIRVRKPEPEGLKRHRETKGKGGE
jgi:hypothetical protein